MVHTSLPSNWKVKHVANLCHMTPVEALGYYVRLLCFVGQHLPHGDLTALDDTMINGAVDAPTDRANSITFAAALRHPTVKMLVQSRRGKWRLNGWNEYNGKYWRKLQTDRKRKNSDGKPQENKGVFRGFSTPPNLTLPNGSKNPPYPPKGGSGASPEPSKRQAYEAMRASISNGSIRFAAKNGVTYQASVSTESHKIVLVAIGYPNADPIVLGRHDDWPSYEWKETRNG